MVKKMIVVLILVAGTPLLFSFSERKPVQTVVRTIVVDAGHGLRGNGSHDGAKGSFSYEDDICLDVARKLAAQLRQEFPEIKVVETRKDKYIVDLHERADIANQAKGDLFISIHVNAMPPIRHSVRDGYRWVGKGSKRRKVAKYRVYYTPNTTTKGTETYIWGAHKTEDKEVAIRENAPMMQEDNYKEKYGEIDPNSPEFMALSLLKTKQFFKRSATLAGMVEDQFEKVGRVSLGQKQRQVGIWVLQATAMPSVLVETGYITNPDDEKYLNSEAGQDEISDCVTKAVRNYVNWIENTQTNITSRSPVSAQPEKDSKAFLDMIENREKNRNPR